MKNKIILMLFCIPVTIYGQTYSDSVFNELQNHQNWQLKLTDDGTGHWQDNWFLDGKIAKVVNSANGMHLLAGPEFGNDAHHMVLWTKQSFQGDVKIEFDYTRTDTETKAVNILYIQATGREEGEFVKDISQWNQLRAVPSMRTYFNNMNTLHISFAAFPNNDENVDYIRVRRYPVLPDKNFRELEVEPSFFDTGLFKTGVTCHIVVLKTNQCLFFEVKSNNETKGYFWDISHLPPLTDGRIGLRHMYTRSALYRNIKVYTK